MMVDMAIFAYMAYKYTYVDLTKKKEEDGGFEATHNNNDEFKMEERER